LGRGLDALLPSVEPQRADSALPHATPGAATAAVLGEVAGNVFLCAIEKIVPQRGQPRHHFKQEALEDLAQSIREFGVLEPLLVRKVGDDRFELIAGERRWRAAQKAGLREVMVVVREVSNNDAFELALIENIQREDLNPIELAEALQRLIDEHHYTQEALAKRIGKDRSTLANALRLLKLPQSVRDMVTQEQLTEGHARALLSAPSEASMSQLAAACLRGKWSVRQLESEVRALKQKKAAPDAPGAKSPATRDLEMRLARKFGTRCLVRDKKGKGELVLHYSSLDELDRLLELLL
jgi:ParB family chromosome partitioning protein